MVNMDLDNIKHGSFEDSDTELITSKRTIDHLTNIKNLYYNLALKDDLTVTEIYSSVNNYFTTKNFIRKSTQKRIFNVCIAPLRRLCKYPAVKRHFLKFFACAMYRYIEQDYDFVLGITGTEGTGKSACSLLLTQYLQELGMQFDLDKDIFFRGDATEKGFEKVWDSISKQRKHVIIFDEGKAFFDKRQSMNAMRVESLQELTSQRSKNHILMINVGDISEIDVYFRDRRCRAILTLPDRGLGVILFNKGIIGMGGDRFNLEWFNKILTFTNGINFIQQISMLSQLSTQYGLGSIPHVNEQLYLQYNEMKDKRNSILDQRRQYFSKKRVEEKEKKMKKMMEKDEEMNEDDPDDNQSPKFKKSKQKDIHNNIKQNILYNYIDTSSTLEAEKEVVNDKVNIEVIQQDITDEELEDKNEEVEAQEEERENKEDELK